MYSVGSLADLISGKNTPNKPAVELKDLPATPLTIAKSPKQNTPNSAKKPVTPKMEKKNTPNKGAATPKQNGKTPQKKVFTPKQKGQTPEKKVTPQKRKAEDSESGNDTAAKKVKTDKKAVPVKRNMENALKRIVGKEKKPHVSDPEQEERTVFVGNVPLTADIKELKRFFALYGKVDSLRIRGIPAADPKMPKKVALIKKKFHANRKSLQCYVVYKTAADAIKALEANGKEFKGHHLMVDRATSGGQHDQKKAIFIGNLPFDAEEDDVWSLFQDCGDIMSVRLVRDKRTRMGKGFGYVNFSSTDAVELALQMEDIKLGKREIRVSRCSKGGATDGQNKKRTADVSINIL